MNSKSCSASNSNGKCIISKKILGNSDEQFIKDYYW